jgi:hypothetical protein
VWSRGLSPVALALCASAALACSFSHSSESSSDSSNNSSDSSVHSSDSSSPGHEHRHDDEQKSFVGDVEQYTAAFVEAGGSQGDSFFSGVGDLAREHGVSDWESDPAVWEAIGRGLARSPATTAQRVAYQSAWTGGDPARQSAVAKGISAVQ